MKNPITASIEHVQQFKRDVFWGPWNQNRVDSWPGLFAVTGGLILTLVTYGLNDLWPLFSRLQLKDPKLAGVTRTQLSISHSLKGGLSHVFGIVAGYLLPIIGARCCGLIVVVALFAFLWLTSYFGNSVGAMIGTYTIPGTISIAMLNSPVTSMATTWFHKYRSFATSFAMVGAGIGNLIVSPIAGAYEKTHDWRQTLRYISFFCAVGLVGALLSRTRPGYELDEINEEDLSSEVQDRSKLTQDDINTVRFTFKEIVCIALPTRTYLSMLMEHVLFGFAFSSTLYMVISYPLTMGRGYYASTKRMGIEVVSTFFSWYGVGQCLGAIIIGILATKFDNKRVTVVTLVLASLCGFIWIFMRTYYGFGILMFFMGFINAGTNTTFPSAVGDRYFGPNIGILMGFVYFVPISSMTAPTIITAIAEHMNANYTVPCIFVGLCYLAAAIAVQFVMPEVQTYAFYKRKMAQEQAQMDEVTKKQNSVE